MKQHLISISHNTLALTVGGKTVERGNKMIEVVKVVNGFEITRTKGTRRFYYVIVKEGKGWKEFHEFHTIKAAAEFCESITK